VFAGFESVCRSIERVGNVWKAMFDDPIPLENADATVRRTMLQSLASIHSRWKVLPLSHRSTPSRLLRSLKSIPSSPPCSCCPKSTLRPLKSMQVRRRNQPRKNPNLQFENPNLHLEKPNLHFGRGSTAVGSLSRLPWWYRTVVGLTMEVVVFKIFFTSTL